MTDYPCFECKSPAKHEHHVVPRSSGGTRTVPLCEECHAKAHGMHGGPPLGWGSSHSKWLVDEAIRLYEIGWGLQKIADHFNAHGVKAIRGAKLRPSSFHRAFRARGVKMRPRGRPPMAA